MFIYIIWLFIYDLFTFPSFLLDILFPNKYFLFRQKFCYVNARPLFLLAKLMKSYSLILVLMKKSEQRAENEQDKLDDLIEHKIKE